MDGQQSPIVRRKFVGYGSPTEWPRVSNIGRLLLSNPLARSVLTPLGLNIEKYISQMVIFFFLFLWASQEIVTKVLINLDGWGEGGENLLGILGFV